MKKIIMLIVLFMFVSFNAFATCSPTQGKIIYGPSVDAPAVINYQTGIGYCSPSDNVGGVIVDLSKCDRVNELIPGDDYVAVISIDTEGFTFVEPATGVSIAIRAYTSMDNLCEDYGATLTTLNAVYNEDKTKLVSSISDNFILVGRPYFLVYIPSVTYDKENIDRTDLLVSFDIIDANSICLTCGNSICTDQFNLGSMACTDTHSLLFSYCIYNNNEWWTGLAITNLTNDIGSITFNIYADGSVIQVNKTVEGNKVLAITVDQLIGNNIVSGDSCYVIVESNFDMRGVCVQGNPNYGQSTYVAEKLQ